MATERSRREERREREIGLRRSDVLAAAIAEFAAHGFDGAQVARIAARAEVSLATIYSMFEGKDRLFEAVVVEGAGALLAAMQAEVAAVAEPRERILRLIDAGFERFQSEPDLFRIFARATHGLPARIRQSMGEAAQQSFSDFARWTVGVARSAAEAGALGGIDPEAFALALIGALTTTTAAVTEGVATRASDELAAGIRALFARLLAPEESP
jgi:AcrR family transcriptional regulator